MENSLCNDVRKDIERFLKENTELLFNERDLQMHLAIFLKSLGNKYDDVDLEYHLPVGFNSGFDKAYKQWETEKPSIDIVVRRGQEFLPVELKYKLKAVQGSISRLGVKNIKNIEIIPNQAAQNLGRYAFWKDVKRVELVKKFYPTVKNGLAVFVTNDETYLKSKEGTDYYGFRMIEGDTISGVLKWEKEKDKYPAITLDGTYQVKWESIEKPSLIKEIHYTILTI